MSTTLIAEPQDAQLLVAVRSRDIDALHVLYQRHGGVVHRCATVTSGHRIGVDADQLTVDAFVALWDDPPSAADEDDVRAHLLRLVGRLALR